MTAWSSTSPERGGEGGRNAGKDGGESTDSVQSSVSEGLAVRLHPRQVLRWSFLSRMALVSGVLLAALLVWRDADPQETLIITVVFVVSAAVTGWAGWRTFVQGAPAGKTFLYLQLGYDALVVTAAVHVTGGAGSAFAALYIPLIAGAAVLLPFPGVFLIGGLSAILYLADAVWGHGADAFSEAIILQVLLFAAVAIVAGILGDRLRRAGAALGVVESELRRLRLDTSDILATVTSGILTVDEEGRMVYLNPAGESLLNLDARQWTGAPVLEAVGQVAPQLARLLSRSLDEGRSLYRRTAEASRDGERLVLGVGTTVREAEGQPRSVTAVFQDITDSERLAMLNRQNERLEAVAALSASMAHEIKNPLASIRSAVEQFSGPRLSPEDRDTLIRMVVRESERLSRFLSDFIDFSRVQVGRPEMVDLRELVGEAATVARQHPDTNSRQVGIEVRLRDTPVPLKGDSDILHRAVLNLLLNAVQFSPEGSSVEVHVEDLREAAGAPDVGVARPVRIRVRDRGPGIPEEALNRVFDPFFTTREGGTGLGLAMVHRAAEVHGGAVVVEHPPGGGTEFVLYLPGAAGVPDTEPETEAEHV